jgi:hypothetical protein
MVKLPYVTLSRLTVSRLCHLGKANVHYPHPGPAGPKFFAPCRPAIAPLPGNRQFPQTLPILLNWPVRQIRYYRTDMRGCRRQRCAHWTAPGRSAMAEVTKP